MRLERKPGLGDPAFLVEISQNEAKVLRTITDSAGKLTLENLAKKAGLADSAVARAVLNLSQNQLVKEKVEKRTELSLTDEGRTFARVGLPERIILLEVRNHREVEITEAGRNLGSSDPSQPEVSSLTGDLIASGEWEKIKLRSYNVSSAVPQTFPGKYHPYLRFLRIVKSRLVALGFREAVGPLVETAFINCDCLYMPQDHPAREIHDLYYLKDPSRASLEEYGSLVDRVAQTHENGWKTGSTGWRYKFSRDEASKLILRSHGTALSVRTMLSKDLQIPEKYFAIARCFRPDMLDKTHLTEFNQAEGIVLDPSLNLRNLLGI